MRVQALIEACFIAVASLVARVAFRRGRAAIEGWVIRAASVLLPPPYRDGFREDCEREFYEARGERGADWSCRLLNVLEAAAKVAVIRWAAIIRRAQRAVVVVSGSVVTTTLLLRSPSGALVGAAFGVSMHFGVVAGERDHRLSRVAGAFARRSPWARRGLVLLSGLPVVPLVEVTALQVVLAVAPHASLATQMLCVAVPVGLALGYLLGVAYRHVPGNATPSGR